MNISEESTRSYRLEVLNHDAIRELRRLSGDQSDPAVDKS